MFELTLNAANVIPFVLVDASNVEVAGLGAAFTVALSKNGAAFAPGAGSQAELGNGWYVYTTTAGECATIGPLALRITAAGCAQQNLVLAVGAAGAGSETVTLTSTDGSSAPLEGVAVWVTSDSAGSHVVAGTQYSSMLGATVFYLDPGVYYVWRQGGGVTWTNPQTITVVAS